MKRKQSREVTSRKALDQMRQDVGAIIREMEIRSSNAEGVRVNEVGIDLDALEAEERELKGQLEELGRGDEWEKIRSEACHRFPFAGRFKDPNAVEGEERADRFAYNFKKCGGDSGALEQCSIFWEAKHDLSPEHFKRFCARIDTPRNSAEFQVIDLLAEQYRRLRQILDTELEPFAVMKLLLFSHDGDFFEDVIRLAQSTAAARNADEIVADYETLH
jgi:hypothetical protein